MSVDLTPPEASATKRRQKPQPAPKLSSAGYRAELSQPVVLAPEPVGVHLNFGGYETRSNGSKFSEPASGAAPGFADDPSFTAELDDAALGGIPLFPDAAMIDGASLARGEGGDLGGATVSGAKVPRSERRVEPAISYGDLGDAKAPDGRTEPMFGASSVAVGSTPIAAVGSAVLADRAAPMAAVKPKPPQPQKVQSEPVAVRPVLQAEPAPSPSLRKPSIVEDAQRSKSDTAKAETVLALNGLSKSFGDTVANDGVDFELKRGEKHALLGENGAGKSTLVNMLYGVLRPDSGEIVLFGEAQKVTSPERARALGLGMVFQHFAGFDALSVEENLAVALPKMDRPKIKAGAKEIAAKYGLSISLGQRFGALSAGEKQRVELVRCLLQKPQILILDEPTSVLTPQESKALFEAVDRLADDGMSVIFITHRLAEVRTHCDRATVLRGGKVVGACDPALTSAPELAELMIGAVPERPPKQAAFVGGARLEVKDLSMPAVSGGIALSDISFKARRGEILGIAGVAGEGQAELFAALSGELPTSDAGAIQIDGKAVGKFGPARRRAFGAAFAPEERRGHAAISGFRLSQNIGLSRWLGTGFRARKASAEIRESRDVRAEGSDPYASLLSGGNLQKFVIGRELMSDPSLLVAAQPTWGVDVGAAQAIHSAILDLRLKGSAVVVISQDLDEIFALCDRVAVLYRGKLTEPQSISSITADELGLMMAGAKLDPIEAREEGANA